MKTQGSGSKMMNKLEENSENTWFWAENDEKKWNNCENTGFWAENDEKN